VSDTLIGSFFKATGGLFFSLYSHQTILWRRYFIFKSRKLGKANENPGTVPEAPLAWNAYPVRVRQRRLALAKITAATQEMLHFPLRCEWTSFESSLLQRCQETVILRSESKSTGITLLDRGQFRRYRLYTDLGSLGTARTRAPRLKLLACTYPILCTRARDSQ